MSLSRNVEGLRETLSNDDLPWFLASQQYEHVLDLESLDFHRRSATILGEPEEKFLEQSSNYLILTRTSDAEADEIGLRLVAAGHNYLRIDYDQAPEEVSLSFQSQGELEAVVRGRRGSPTTLWFRSFEVEGADLPSRSQQLVREFLRDQWGCAIEALGDSPNVRVVNRPSKVRELTRIRQLRLADDVGLPHPRSLVSNETVSITEFVRGCGEGAIAKSLGQHFIKLSPGNWSSVLPIRVQMEDIPRMTRSIRANPAPLLFQEYITPDHELRVDVVGSSVHSFAVRKIDPQDVWTSPLAVDIVDTPTPDDLQELLLAYLRKAGLDVGSFDILVAKSGQWVFLEVNPAGDWRYFENMAGCSHVTQMMTSYLIDEAI